MILLVSLITSSFLIKLLLPFLKKYLIDTPNYRSSHKKLIPRGGGISFVLVTLFGNIIYLVNNDFSSEYFLPIICLPVAVIGFIDDFFNIKSLYRLLVQIFTSVSLLYFFPRLIYLFNFNILITSIFLVTCIISIVNFVNFMDGIDGLVAICLFISLGSIFIYREDSQYIQCLLGSLLGFLFWNWSPAKVFMGDIGSTFLGVYYAGLLIFSDDLYELVGLLLINAPLLMDAFLCVIRRQINKQNPFKAHKLHLYQRLVSAGWPHKKVSILYGFLTLLSAIIFIKMGLNYLLCFLIVEVIIGFYLDQKIAKPFQNIII